MCGILGIFGFNFSNAEDSLSLQNHRGPDNTGIWQKGDVFLGHKRLSIIDLNPRSNQPFKIANEVIIFNGEIYNYKSLRLDLEKDGYNFRTKSDTEVLMNLYKKYNYDCIRHIKGMFAFCLYDKSKNIIWISRDRYGIKPLYYCIDNHSLIFGSSLDSIISSNIIKPNLSKNSINLYLFLSFVPTPYTIYENIYKLKPGHEIIFSVNDFKINKYWNEDRVEYYSDTADSLDKLLDLSVQEHSVSDRPIGTFLSGGLDSTLITLKYSKHFKDFYCYTAISKMINQSDKKFSDLVTNSLNLKHTKIDIDNIQNMDIMDELINFIDEPVYDSSMLPTYLISKAAKQQGIDVLLAGNGADEIFFGYDRITAARFSLLLSLPAISGAGFLKAIHVVKVGDVQLGIDILLVTIISALAALLAIRLMMSWLTRSNFNIFVIYRLILGCILLLAIHHGWITQPI